MRQPENKKEKQLETKEKLMLVHTLKHWQEEMRLEAIDPERNMGERMVT